jgi:hypothetical protein
VTLARKGAKSRRPATSLRSKATKAGTDVERLRAANAELKKKLAEALERQTATSEVLQVISSSPGTLEPVFETILANATRICEAAFGSMLLIEGNEFRRVALYNAPREFGNSAKKRRAWQPRTLFRQSTQCARSKSQTWRRKSPTRRSQNTGVPGPL